MVVVFSREGCYAGEVNDADLGMSPIIRRFCTPEHIEVGTAEAFDRFVRDAEASVLDVGVYQVPVWTWRAEGGGRGTVVLTHGWAAHAAIWRTWVRPLLKAGFSVVVFDAPAHGRASGETSNLLIHADALQAIAGRHPDVVGLVGHSLGGMASVVVASRWARTPAEAHRVRGLKVVALATPAHMAHVVERYRDVFGKPEAELVEIEAWIQDVSGLAPSHVGFWLLEEVGGVDVLVIHDRDDREAWCSATREAVARLPAASFVEVTGTGHEMIVVDRATIRRSLAFLLGEAPPGSSTSG